MMKNIVLISLLCISSYGFAQTPEAAKYASRQILLVDPTPGTEAVAPMSFVTDGKPEIEFVPVHDVKAALERGGRPLALGDILSALGEATEQITKLQAENDRLWKVAMKDAPKPDTVIVQQPAPVPAGPSQAELAAREQAEANARRQQMIQMLLMQNANRQQPYQIPMPVNPNNNRGRNCIANTVGTSTYTNCN